jgi:hypothetical protein
MDLSRAFMYAFDDPEWMSKLAMVFLLTFASVIFMPFLLAGLVPFAMLMGYMLEIVNNVRQGNKIILPRWRNYGQLMSRGGGVLLGLTAYHIPVLLLSCCVWVSGNLFSDGAVNGLLTLTTLCCVTPFLLIYTVVGWMILAVGVTEYAAGEPSGVFFEWGRLFGIVRELGWISIQWFFFSLLAHFLLTLIAFTIIGTLVLFALSLPVQAHLIGQYARQIEAHKPKRRAYA